MKIRPQYIRSNSSHHLSQRDLHHGSQAIAHVEEGDAVRVMNCSEQIFKINPNLGFYLAPAFTLSLFDNSTPLMAELGTIKKIITTMPLNFGRKPWIFCAVHDHFAVRPRWHLQFCFTHNVCFLWKGVGLYERLIYAGTQFQDILNTEASTRIKFCWRGWESSEYGFVHFSQVFLQGILNTFSFCCSLPWFTFLDFLNHFKDLITCCPGRPLVLAGNEKVLYK